MVTVLVCPSELDTMRERSVTPQLTPPPPSHGPRTPPPPSPSLSPPTHDLVQTEQMDTASDEMRADSPLDVPVVHMASHDHVSLCSDISDDSIKEEIGPQTPPTLQKATPTPSPITPPTGPVTPPPVQESTPLQSPISAHHMNVSDISSDMDSSLGQSTSETETSKPHPPSPPTHSDDLPTTTASVEGHMTMVAGESADVSSLPAEMRIVEGLKMSTNLAPPLSPSGKTPIKRKVCTHYSHCLCVRTVH